MNGLNLKPIGRIRMINGEPVIALEPEYAPALEGLDSFGYIQVIWWFDGCDNKESRSKLTEIKPYKKGPEKLGTFATRSPERPNPIALTAVYVTYIDHENGIIGAAYIDAKDGSPVLDIKPYTPSLDRVESPSVPEWCRNWPECIEDSGEFDWSSEFNF